MNKMTKRQEKVLEMAKKCVDYMREHAVKVVKEDKRNPEFRVVDLLNDMCVPEDFELRWNVKRGIVDAMKEGVEVGLFKKTFRTGGSWRYIGNEIKKAQEEIENDKKEMKRKIDKALENLGKAGFDFDDRQYMDGITFSYDTVIAMAERLCK